MLKWKHSASHIGKFLQIYRTSSRCKQIFQHGITVCSNMASHQLKLRKIPTRHIVPMTPTLKKFMVTFPIRRTGDCRLKGSMKGLNQGAAGLKQVQGWVTFEVIQKKFIWWALVNLVESRKVKREVFLTNLTNDNLRTALVEWHVFTDQAIYHVPLKHWFWNARVSQQDGVGAPL